MDDVIEIGVFAPGEGDALGEPLYLQRHRIRSGEQAIRITLPREPARAGIDPYRKLIEPQWRRQRRGREGDRGRSRRDLAPGASSCGPQARLSRRRGQERINA